MDLSWQECLLALFFITFFISLNLFAYYQWREDQKEKMKANNRAIAKLFYRR